MDSTLTTHDRASTQPDRMLRGHGGSFESGLIEALQPVRSFVLATAVYHLFHTGLFDLLHEGTDTSVRELAAAGDFDDARLAGFLRYLANEELISWSDDRVALTPRARELEEFRAWYIMLIGGYAGTFLDVGPKLRAGSGWASRNGEQVGIGACGISHYDSIPLTRSLMADIPKECSRLLDLGCGNGLYLVEFCKELPGLHAVGVEPDLGSWRAGTEMVRLQHMNDRIRLVNAGALEYMQSNDPYAPDFIVLGFVLHEILGQEGERGVVAFLREITHRYPELYLIIIEVENRIDDAEAMNHGLSLAYYNPYYLLHYVTNQKLVTGDQWEAIFADSGLEILSVKGTDPSVDSTGLEIGYLLKRR